MDINEVETITSNLGFPILCVIALSFFIYKSYQNITDRNMAREERLYTMIENNHKEMERLEKTNSEFVAVLNTFKTDLEDIKDAVVKSGSTKRKGGSTNDD